MALIYHDTSQRSLSSTLINPHQNNMREPDELKNAGLKATLPRLKVLSLFESSKERHLSAEDVYKILLTAGEDVGLATVYRVLTQFEQAGVIGAPSFRKRQGRV